MNSLEITGAHCIIQLFTIFNMSAPYVTYKSPAKAIHRSDKSDLKGIFFVWPPSHQTNHVNSARSPRVLNSE